MWWTVLAGAISLTTGALFYSGIIPVSSLFGGTAFDRRIEASVGSVATALSDLPVAQLAMVGGMESSRIQIRSQRTATGYNWPIISDGKTLFTMRAEFEPDAEGRTTRVRSWTEQGSDFDKETAPIGFRSVGGLNGLLTVLMETELSEFGPPGERLNSAEIRRRQVRAIANMVALEAMSNPRGLMMEASRRMDEMGPPSEGAPIRQGGLVEKGWSAGNRAPQQGGRWEASGAGWGGEPK